MEYTQEQVNLIVEEAETEAYWAASRYLQEKLGGQDQYACGFAWVSIPGIRANSKLGKMLANAGVRKNDYEKCFQIWNPSGLPVQNIDCKEEGARAAAEVFKRYGITAYAGSRLD